MGIFGLLRAKNEIRAHLISGHNSKEVCPSLGRFMPVPTPSRGKHERICPERDRTAIQPIVGTAYGDGIRQPVTSLETAYAQEDCGRVRICERTDL
jgi:hypothetical protein